MCIRDSFENDWKAVKPVKPNTIAKSLAIGDPASGMFALEVLRETGGTAVACLEEEVVEGIKLLAETEGIFTETAGGVVISGLRRLAESGKIKKDELTVAFITGNGLKTQEVVEDLIDPIQTSPDYDDFEKAMNERGYQNLANPELKVS